MFFQSKIDDSTWILVDAEASGAFAKNELEGDSQMTPANAVRNSLHVAAVMARALSAKLADDFDPRMEVQVEFGVKADGSGNVMIGTNPEGAQFRVTLRWAPPPPTV